MHAARIAVPAVVHPAPRARSTATPSGAASDYDTLVIGGGQAGLAAAYYLQRAGVRFTVLDASAEPGASWRRRWDSLRLFTPAQHNSLPGLPFPGARDALPGKDEVAQYLKTYARRFDLPVRSGVAVARLHRDGGRFVVGTVSGESITAASVIVATGAHQRPYVPPCAQAIAPHVVQRHSADYRRPTDVPEGAVLVVGAGNSGAQIALELAGAGRRVYLSGRDIGSLPRRLLGRDVFDWLWPTLMRLTVESAVGRRLMQGKRFAGDPLIGMPASAFDRPRLQRVGRTVAAQGGFPVVETGRVLNDVTAVVWCTGFRPDFAWLELPVLGLDGYPLHRRGMAVGVPGLGFVGLRHQYRLGSALLGGVGEDAAHVAARIAEYAGRRDPVV